MDGTVDADNSGFLGDGYANGDNAIGAAVEWAVAADANTTVSLEWRFSNNGTTARPGNLVVNGTALGTVDFPVTGDWSTWQTASQDNVELIAGSNSIRLEATTTDGLANVDSLTITGSGIDVVACGSVDGDTDSDTDSDTDADSDSDSDSDTDFWYAHRP